VSAEGRRQKAEGRRQKAEGRRQKAEGKRQKTKDKTQKAKRKNRRPRDTMLATDIIAAKRDGARLSAEQIRWFIDGYSRDAIPDYQMAALLMAVYLRGMEAGEQAHLAEAMLRSGRTLSPADYGGSASDKHSTGGVGDKVSLILAPLAAAAGVKVPMMSGRGLGHTGGTLDKLESIAGFRTGLSLEETVAQVKSLGVAMIGQTTEIVPADRKMYRLRDVTATVASLPLIASSIMSKKIAEGVSSLVLDVKTGSGAFMQRLEDSRALARAMVDIGAAHGLRCRALITGMHQPLGTAVGHSLEVAECLQVMATGEGAADLVDLSVELTAHMLQLEGLEADLAAARARCRRLLADGSALKLFRELVRAQGGDVSMVDEPARLPRAPQTEDVRAPRGGIVRRLDALSIGRLVLGLGGGRTVITDPIDYGAGVVLHRKQGDRVEAGEPLLTVHHSGRGVEGLAERVLAACELGDEPPEAQPLLLETLE
jgi:pyrimidine-nucleoside phosphorylase